MSDSGEIPVTKPPDWLPVDWTMEVKSRNGKNIKSYIHPQTGYKFYSKPKVLEYLRTVKKDSSTLQKETVINGNAGSDSHGYVTEIPQENGLHSGKSYEIETSEMLQSEEMDAETSANWLPADWTEEIKVQDGQTVKNYVDPLWGHKFSSKRQVFEYLGALKNNCCTAQKETPDRPGKTNGTQVSLPYVSTLTTPLKNGSQSKSPMKAMDSTKSLPDGWIIETKPRKSGPRAGYPDKQYIDPVTGRKFKSKQKVFEYLGIVEPNSSTFQQKETFLDYVSNFNLNVDTTEGVTPPLQMVESQNVETLNRTGFSSISKETSSGEQPGRKLSPEELPPGWIKEVKSQKSAHKTRNVSYFIDPVSGYVFASRKDAWRYSESGDISKCVKKPKKRGEMGFVSLNMDKTKDVTSPPQLVESQNVKALDDGINSERNCSMKLRRQININESGGGTPPPQLGQSQNVDTLNHIDNSPISKETSSSEQPLIKSGMDQLLPEGLPPGWIKEVKPQSQRFAHKTKNVSYFIDPVSGYVFTSQKDAWRYSESGDISKCVKRPKKRGEMGFVSLPLNTKDSTKPLPDGWITRTKRRKFGFRARYKQYIDPVKGYIFTSLTDAWRYLEAGDISKCVKKPNKRGEMGLATRHSSTNIDETDGGTPPPKLVESVSVETLNHAGYSSISKEISSSEQPERKIGMEQLSPEGLPPGWIKEVKTQKFANMTRNISYFIDPVSGYVFTSKKDAWRFIETGNITKCVKRPKKREEMGFVSPLPLKTMDSTKLLPDGWITETKPRKFGSRAGDKQYIDPVSGYVFTSRTDVWRYLEAGDISKCVKKPKKIGEMGSATEQSSDASPAVKHELECGTTEEQPYTGKNAGSKRGSETADTDVSRKRRQRRTPEAKKGNDSSINLKKETRFSRRVLNYEQALSSEAGNNGENDEILNSQDRTFQHFGEDDWSTLDDAIETLDGTLAFEDNAQVDNIFQTDTSQVLDFGEPNNLLSSTIFLPDMNCPFSSGSKAGPSKLAWKRTRK